MRCSPPHNTRLTTSHTNGRPKLGGTDDPLVHGLTAETGPDLVADKWCQQLATPRAPEGLFTRGHLLPGPPQRPAGQASGQWPVKRRVPICGPRSVGNYPVIICLFFLHKALPACDDNCVNPQEYPRSENGPSPLFFWNQESSCLGVGICTAQGALSAHRDSQIPGLPLHHIDSRDVFGL